MDRAAREHEKLVDGGLPSTARSGVVLVISGLLVIATVSMALVV